MNKKLNKKEIAERIKALRKKKNWSPQHMASEIGVSRTTYYKYENGSLTIPIERAYELAKATGTSLEYIYTGKQTSGELRGQAFMMDKEMDMLMADLVNRVLEWYREKKN